MQHYRYENIAKFPRARTRMQIEILLRSRSAYPDLVRPDTEKKVQAHVKKNLKAPSDTARTKLAI